MKELGPIVRALLRNGGSALVVVLEMTFGFTVIASLFAAGRWYIHTGARDLGHPHADLVAITSSGPALALDHDQAFARARADARAEAAAIAAVPGVRDVVPTSRSLFDHRWSLPFGLWTNNARTLASDSVAAVGYVITGGADLGDVLGLRYVVGRPLSALAAEEKASAVVLSRTAALEIFGHVAVVGEPLAGDELPPSRVVGVFEDATLMIPFVAKANSIVLRAGDCGDERERMYVVRTAPGARAGAVDAIHAALVARRPERVYRVTAYEPRNARYRKIASGIVTILVLMGGLLGIVALLGALAVSSFLVASRTRQIGVRRALGASRADIIRYFLLENLIMTSGGIVVGSALTLLFFVFAARLFPGLQMRARDLAITALLLLADGGVAALVPARRASRIEPSVATRTL